MASRDDVQGLREGFRIDGNGELAKTYWRLCIDQYTRPDGGERSVFENVITMDESSSIKISSPRIAGNPYYTYNMHDIDEKHYIYHLHYMMNKGMIHQSNKAHHVCNTHDKRVFENLDGNRELAEA